MTGRHYSWVCVDDLETPPLGEWDDPKLHEKLQKAYNRLGTQLAEKVFYKLKYLRSPQEGETMRTTNIYEIWAVYAENPNSPVVFRPKEQFSFGHDEEEAVIRSGIHLVLAAATKQPTTEPLDPRFITIITREIGKVKVGSES